MLLSTIVFMIVQQLEFRAVREEFNHDAGVLAVLLQNSINDNLRVLSAVDALYASSHEVTRDEFHVFTLEQLKHFSGIQAVEWVPRISQRMRIYYEAAARRDGLPDFRIVELNPQNNLTTAGPRNEYFPVYFAEPREGNEAAMGFDLLSDSTRRLALVKARDSAMMTATGRITLVQETGRQSGFLVFQPIYRNGVPHDTIEERRRHLTGFALGVFRLRDMVEAALSGLERKGIEFRLTDETSPTEDQTLYSSSEDASPENAALTRNMNLTVADRTWVLELGSTPAYIASHKTWHAWLVLASGAFITVLLAFYLLNLERHAAEIERSKDTLHRTLDESRRHEAETRALFEGSRAVMRHREFQDAARAIFDISKDLTGASAGYVALMSRDGNENEVLFLDSGGLPCTVDPDLPMPIRGLRGEAYRSGRAVYHNSFPESEWQGFMPDGHVRLDNVLFAPLMLEDTAVGIIGLANKSGGFTENDAHMASALGAIVSTALLNSRTLDSLKNSEERFRSVAQTAKDAIISINDKGSIVFWNDAAADIFGYPPVEAAGKSVTLIMPERFRSAHLAGMGRAVATAETPVIGKTLEMAGLRKDGSEFPLEITVTTWLTREGRFFTAIIRDITKRKHAEQERERLISRLQEALVKIKTLSGLLPICSSCKKIRDDNGYWTRIESYICEHSEAEFSHSICPDCATRLYPEIFPEEGGETSKT